MEWVVGCSLLIDHVIRPLFNTSHMSDFRWTQMRCVPAVSKVHLLAQLPIECQEHHRADKMETGRIWYT